MRFLLTADWHLRQARPRCRLDEDWVETQMQQIRRIGLIAAKENVPVVVTGDVFHHPRVATEVVNRLIDELKQFKDGVYFLAGNHDLPYHSLDNLKQSSIGTLLHRFPDIGKMWKDFGFACTWAHFGNDLKGVQGTPRFIHRLVWPSAESRPQIADKDIGQTAEELLEEFPDNPVIFTGDYHHAFHFEKDGRHVINPGCINIQASDMIGYQPGVDLVDLRNGISVERIPLPEDGSLVTDSHIQADKERDTRIDALVEKVSEGQGVSLDFASNVQAKLPKISKAAADLVESIMAEDGEAI